MISSIKLILVSFFSFLFSFLPLDQKSIGNPISPVASPGSELKTNINKNPVSLEVNGIKFNAYYYKIENPEKLELYPNFSQKQTAAEIVNQRKCSALFNGSFYDKDNSPIGLFVSQSKKSSPATFNSLLNGFLMVNSDDSLTITDLAPLNMTRWVLQSGPLLFKDGRALPLRINDDENARRIVSAITKDNKLIFITFYDPENNLQGPYLAYLPQYLNEFALTTGIKIEEAINLDGGGASAFYANNFFLPEFNSIGSYFCLK